MADYDPKRPRPRADDDEPAPVEALIAADAPPVAQVGDPGSSDDSGADADVADADEADADEAGPVVDLRPSPGVERHLHPVPNGSSEVPVADRPVEPTTNRAVALVALLGAVAVGVAVVVVVRRRRR